jgi:hypothetical protein
MTTKSAVKQAAEAHDRVSRMTEAYNHKVAALWAKHEEKATEFINSLPPDVRAIYDRIAASGAEE